MEAKIVQINNKKKIEVENIKKLVRSYPILGIINLENLPAAHFLKLKYKLRDKILIKGTKKRLMKIAFQQLEKEKKEITKINGLLNGIPALIFTREDEFKLQKILNKNKSSAFAKAGQIANKDINIKAGPTPFAPGPMIGEFGVLGIKTQVLEGKIHIKEDKLIIKEGEVITDKIASMLSKLGIEPMEIGLNLMFTYKNGEILKKEELNINEEEYLNNIKKAYSEALNLAVGSSFIDKDTIDILIRKAYLNATALSNKVGDLSKLEVKEDTKEEIIEKPIDNKIKTNEKIAEEVQIEKKVEIKEDLSLKKEIKKTENKELNFTKNDQQQAADILKQLTDKKIRGEI